MNDLIFSDQKTLKVCWCDKWWCHVDTCVHVYIF